MLYTVFEEFYPKNIDWSSREYWIKKRAAKRVISTVECCLHLFFVSSSVTLKSNIYLLQNNISRSS